jgi:hypothetical protein
VIADLLREVLRMGDESGVTYVRSKHVPEETLAQLAYLTHDHALTVGREGSSAGERIYAGIQPWTGVSSRSQVHAAARLASFRRCGGQGPSRLDERRRHPHAGPVRPGRLA